MSCNVLEKILRNGCLVTSGYHRCYIPHKLWVKLYVSDVTRRFIGYFIPGLIQSDTLIPIVHSANYYGLYPYINLSQNYLKQLTVKLMFDLLNCKRGLTYIVHYCLWRASHICIHVGTVLIFCCWKLKNTFGICIYR